MEKSDKTNRIGKERRRLLKIFRDLDDNKLKACQSLIDRAAFITVNLQDLEEVLNEKGWTEEYQNGHDQRGIKRSSEADVHSVLTKNLTAIMKSLLEMVPPTQRKSKLAELMKE